MEYHSTSKTGQTVIIRGTTGSDIFHGGNGIDIFVGNGGQDYFYGGYGSSRVDYSWAKAGITVNLGITDFQQTGGGGWNLLRDIHGVYGTAFNDSIIGHGSSANYIDGGAGDDYIYGDAGFDTLIGGLGNDIVHGGFGNDTITGNDGSDTLWGGVGLDVIDGGNGNDILYGEANADTLRGGAGDDILYGGAGDPAAGDIIDGGAGYDIASYATASARVVIDWTQSSYWWQGDAAGDTLIGIEAIELSWNADTYKAGKVPLSAVYGGHGEDSFTGNVGNDIFYGQADNDVLDGGAGDDILDGGGGRDTLIGGGGFDTASYADATDAVTLNFLDPRQNKGDAAGDTFNGIESFALSSFADTVIADNAGRELHGGDGGDKLTGGTGADRLFGDAGDDILFGGDGADRLTGGAGFDTMTGGAGADVFAFLDVADSSTIRYDKIIDFARAQGDKIDLSQIDAVTGGKDNGFTLAASFTHKAGQLVVHSQSDGWLVSGDVNGDGIADFSILVMTSQAPIASDFIL